MVNLHIRDNIFDDLQDAIDEVGNEEIIVVLGDFNRRVGNDIILGVTQKFNEQRKNNNGEQLIMFCVNNELRISNTVFDYKQ